MLALTLSILAIVISICTLLLALRGHLREKARREALEARNPHLGRPYRGVRTLTMSTPTDLRARADELESRVSPVTAGPRTDDERMWLEKAAALRVEADRQEEREWQRTGLIPCSDCGTVVRTKTLETLPAHNCTARQRARRERATTEK